MGDPSESGSSEDGNAEWRAAIGSVAATTSSYVSSFINGSSSTSNTNSSAATAADDDGEYGRKHKPKHYQIKAQKLLDDVLEKTLVIVKDQPIHVPDTDSMSNGGGIRLFKQSTPGIVLGPIDEPQQPRKRPKIIPGKEIDEKSKKFKKRLQSVAVDGENIMSEAKNACQKSLARLEARDAAAKEAAKREEERVAELKKIRGERWLPSIAREREIRLKFQA